ncbi:MAG TPA: dephospho-CoA kinase [Firmicutes bacterium]|nr:dephospho-CoA kinase [Candidatus Fermentithermobacillaceae bacterium]
MSKRKWPGIYVIGLTGGIASGKSTVSETLRDLGARIIDADAITREIQAPGSDALREIREVFGDRVIAPDGTLDRRELGRIVFSSEGARRMLNSIIHPRVINRTKDILREMSESAAKEGPVPIAVVDAPLLLEAGADAVVDEVWVVALPREQQAERLMKREGYSAEEAFSRIDSQMPLEEKEKRADYVIDNSGTIEETREQVFTLWRSLERRLSSASRNNPA